MLVILGSDSLKKVSSNLQRMKSGDSAPTGFSPMQVRVKLSPAVSRYTGDSVWLKNGPVWCGVGCGVGVCGGVGVGDDMLNRNLGNQYSLPINIVTILYTVQTHDVTH